MPIEGRPDGFVVTLDKRKSAVFGVGAALFAALMAAAGIDVFVPVLDGTPLEWIEIPRRPAWLWGGVLTAGGAVLLYVAFWNLRAVSGAGVSIRVDRAGIASMTVVGQREIAWEDIAEIRMRDRALFARPRAGTGAATVAMPTFLTGVEPEELRSHLARYRPDLFGFEATAEE